MTQRLSLMLLGVCSDVCACLDHRNALQNNMLWDIACCCQPAHAIHSKFTNSKFTISSGSKIMPVEEYAPCLTHTDCNLVSCSWCLHHSIAPSSCHGTPICVRSTHIDMIHASWLWCMQHSHGTTDHLMHHCRPDCSAHHLISEALK